MIFYNLINIIKLLIKIFIIHNNNIKHIYNKELRYKFLQIILFQHQLDTIKSKFEIFGVLNVNMTLFYAVSV